MRAELARFAYGLAQSSSSTLVELVRAVAWPAVALVAVLVVVLSDSTRTWLEDVVRKIRKVSALGVDIELSPETAAKVREVTDEAFRELRQRINVEFDRLIRVHQVEDRRNRLVEDVIRPTLARHGPVPQFRSTIYVDDVLFTETLYQLLNYYPTYPGARGRTIPVRFGIVGRAWRSRLDQIEADVPTDQQELIRGWGMTWEQAASAGQGRRSFACFVILGDQQDRVCVIYLDSPEREAFGVTDARKNELAEAVKLGATESGLSSRVQDLMEDMRKKSPFIRIYSDD